MAKWTPSNIAFDVPLSEIVPGNDTFDVAQRTWLADIGDVPRSEREVEEVLTRDPGRVSRDIVAGGKALLTAEDFDAWTCSRLSVDGPEWSDRIMREDKTLVMQSSDGEHPIFTTRAQLELEQHVATLAAKLTQEKNQLFDRAALDRAIADVEAAETRAKGTPFRLTDEQRGMLDLLEYRFGTTNGVAGSGKSSVMAVVHRYCELTGQPVNPTSGLQRRSSRLKTCGRDLASPALTRRAGSSKKKRGEKNLWRAMPLSSSTNSR
jgi:hypothetical protein